MTIEERKEKLKKFIEDNELLFIDGRRNNDCVIVSGFALSIGVRDTIEIERVINEIGTGYDYEEELARVFDYAEANNYGKWWESEDAKKLYKF